MSTNNNNNHCLLDDILQNKMKNEIRITKNNKNNKNDLNYTEKKNEQKIFKIEKISLITTIKQNDWAYDILIYDKERLLVSLHGIIKVYNSKTFEELSSNKITNNDIIHLHKMKNGNILPTIFQPNIYIKN